MTNEDDETDSLDVLTPEEMGGYTWNPVTEQHEKIESLPDGGYKKKYLQLLKATRQADLINLKSAPILSFDKNRWMLQKKRGPYYLLVKRYPESGFDATVLGELADDPRG